MLWLIVIGLITACVLLFQRMKATEQRLDELEERHTEQMWRLHALASRSVPSPETEETVEDLPVPLEEPEPVTEPAPAVTLRRSEERVFTAEPVAAEPPQPREPSDAAAEEAPAPSRLSLDFEDIFGRRLPIWAGGITLAIAGVFLVRYSIEAGLLTPQVRVALSFIFGIVLLAGAEMAYRFEDRVRDERVRQALAGAGLATLYAAFYLAGTQYELIGQTFAFLGLAGVTALAI